MLLAYFGHHKCATTWLNGIIREVCFTVGMKTATFHNEDMFDRDLARYVRMNGIEFLSYTNADMTYIRGLPNLRGFHVVRDPRDIVVSAYFSHLNSHPTTKWPELVEYRRKLQQATKDEGLLIEMEFRRKEFEHLYNWDYSQDNVLELKMEQLVDKPYEQILKVFGFLGVLDESKLSVWEQSKLLLTDIINRMNRRARGWFPVRIHSRSVPAEMLLTTIYHHRFSAKTKGRSLGHEDVTSHYRKGVAGDWINHFKPEHKDFFKRHYSDLLLKLAYEEHSDW